jgi:hypothetical protein
VWSWPSGRPAFATLDGLVLFIAAVTVGWVPAIRLVQFGCVWRQVATGGEKCHFWAARVPPGVF